LAELVSELIIISLKKNQINLKQLFAIFLSMVFMLQCCIKSTIAVAFLFNREKITRTLCVNKNKPSSKCFGKCQLKKSLDKQNTSETNLPNILKEHAETNYILNSSILSLIPLIDGIEYVNHKQVSQATGLLKAIFHPPPVFVG
jgi:hypothetical protein